MSGTVGSNQRLVVEAGGSFMKTVALVRSMSRTVTKLAVIVVLGGLLYAATMNEFSQDTANVIALGYFILTVRLYDLMETIEEWALPAGTS